MDQERTKNAFIERMKNRMQEQASDNISNIGIEPESQLYIGSEWQTELREEPTKKNANYFQANRIYIFAGCFIFQFALFIIIAFCALGSI